MLAKNPNEVQNEETEEEKANKALQIYTKCLKMLENSENTSEYLTILQNQCICYERLKQFDSIISVCLRIIKMVTNLKNRIVEFGEKKKTVLI